MIEYYYHFQVLPEAVKEANGIRSKNRLDCIEHSKLREEDHGLCKLINPKGQLFGYKSPCREFVKANSRRTAEVALTIQNQNISSLYIEDSSFPEYAFGYPNPKKKTSKGDPNPLFPFRNDAYLFAMDHTLEDVELFVIPDSRHLVTSYYYSLIDGELEDEMDELRSMAKVFCPYQGLTL